MAHADTMLYNAVKVMTENPVIRGYLEAHDPQALRQAREAARTFDEESAPPATKEFVVDLFIPFSAVVPVDVESGQTVEDQRLIAEQIARGTFYAEDLYPRLVEALKDTVFTSSDSEWRAEVGDTE